MGLSEKINRRIGKVKERVIRCWLFLVHYVRRTPLRLSFISQPDPVIFAANGFYMAWEITGCYQVVVNGLILPGNIKLIWLDPKRSDDRLYLKFYGRDHTIEREYALHVGAPLKQPLALAWQKEFPALLKINKFPEIVPPAALRPLKHSPPVRPEVMAVVSSLSPAVKIPPVQIRLDPYLPAIV